MELSDYHSTNIGWLLSDIITNIEIQNNGIANVEFAITPQQMYSIAKFLLQFKDEVLHYESKTIIDNCKKIYDYCGIWENMGKQVKREPKDPYECWCTPCEECVFYKNERCTHPEAPENLINSEEFISIKKCK